MFLFAILIGVYSYIIFFLGVQGLITKPIVGGISILFFLIALSLLKISNSIRINKEDLLNFFLKQPSLIYLLLLLISAQIIVSLIGVSGPEISFDSLWYHLTLPKIYLLSQNISHIPGNLLYYSDTPKLTEMFYLPSLMFGSEIMAKLIHFSFGLLSLIVIYRISRKFLSKTSSLLAVLIFYSNLVVGWESISAYVDLTRTFFELMTLWGFVNWIKEKQKKWLITSAVMLGFAISAKIIALESLVIFSILFVYLHIVSSGKLMDLAKSLLTFIFFSILIPLPWLIFSFINTGNLFYPFFDKRIDVGTNFVAPNLLNVAREVINLFIFSNDPISPIYLIVFPLLFLSYFKAKENLKIIYVYSILALFAWYFTPRIGGGRFILPYLPAFSIITSSAIFLLKENTIKVFLIAIVVLIAVTSLGYRIMANKKYIPVILGKETKSEFLTKNLNFSFGDFYDTDNYFKNNMKSTDRVLLFGFHNLYYTDFPFIDSSWVKKGDKFNYVAVQNSNLPEKFNNWQQIYYNPVTKVKLYSLEGKQWSY